MFCKNLALYVIIEEIIISGVFGMSDIFDIKDMTEEDIILQFITPALTAKWDVKKITMET